MLSHICREVATNQKYRIQRITLPDPKEKALYREIALYLPFDVGAAEKTTTMPQTSCADHLDAVRDGKWEMLSEETIPSYKYEVVLTTAPRLVSITAAESRSRSPKRSSGAMSGWTFTARRNRTSRRQDRHAQGVSLETLKK